jgi:cobalt-zinc-cadmium efflux system membrane fusion protein
MKTTRQWQTGVQPGGPKPSRRLPFVPPLQAALLALATAGATGCQKAESKPPPEPPAPKISGETVTFPADAPQNSSFSVESAQPRKASITHLTARLYWDDDTTVRVFTPVAGRVVKTIADLGDQVSIGTPLAEIDSPDFGQALADARTAAGNLRAADKAYSRAKDLLAHGAAAQKDVENAEAALNAARAERERSLSRLTLYGGNESGTNASFKLLSPLAGTVVEKNINPGQEVRADQMLANAPNLFAPLFVVSDPSKLWLQLDVPETDLPLVRPGQRLEVTSIAYPGRIFTGRVEKIGGAMDPATRTVRVRGVVDNPGDLLKAEMYVSADLIIEGPQLNQSAIEIPSKALFMLNNNYYLFVENKPGEYARRQVKVGAEVDGKVAVFDGISAGQKVVVEGGLLLQSLVDPSS